MSRPTYACRHCGRSISATTPAGEQRNHCAICLYARHGCGERMVPLSIALAASKEWMIVHRCSGCTELSTAGISSDDNHLVLMRIAVRPLSMPPFPLELFSEL